MSAFSNGMTAYRFKRCQWLVLSWEPANASLVPQQCYNHDAVGDSMEYFRPQQGSILVSSFPFCSSHFDLSLAWNVRMDKRSRLPVVTNQLGRQERRILRDAHP